MNWMRTMFNLTCIDWYWLTGITYFALNINKERNKQTKK